jgi:sulfate permease family protein
MINPMDAVFGGQRSAISQELAPNPPNATALGIVQGKLDGCGIFYVYTVAVVLIPQAMAYAMLAGMPPVYGLYAAAATPMIAAHHSPSDLYRRPCGFRNYLWFAKVS